MDLKYYKKVISSIDAIMNFQVDGLSEKDFETKVKELKRLYSNNTREIRKFTNWMSKEMKIIDVKYEDVVWDYALANDFIGCKNVAANIKQNLSYTVGNGYRLHEIEALKKFKPLCEKAVYDKKFSYKISVKNKYIKFIDSVDIREHLQKAMLKLDHEFRFAKLFKRFEKSVRSNITLDEYMDRVHKIQPEEGDECDGFGQGGSR